MSLYKQYKEANRRTVYSGNFASRKVDDPLTNEMTLSSTLKAEHFHGSINETPNEKDAGPLRAIAGGGHPITYRQFIHDSIIDSNNQLAGKHKIEGSNDKDEVDYFSGLPKKDRGSIGRDAGMANRGLDQKINNMKVIPEGGYKSDTANSHLFEHTSMMNISGQEHLPVIIELK